MVSPEKITTSNIIQTEQVVCIRNVNLYKHTTNSGDRGHELASRQTGLGMRGALYFTESFRDDLSVMIADTENT